MDLIIGRDAATSQLKIVNGKKASLLGQPGCVPPTVSRQHCKLHIDDATGTISIHNLKPMNVTYVNGQPVMNKVIRRGDAIELSASRFPVRWEDIDQLMPQTIDITPLRKIWDDYDEAELLISQNEAKLNGARSAAMMIPFVGRYLGGAIGSRSLVGAKTTYEKKRELKLQFQKLYVCPKCGHFMGYKSYDLLIQDPCCPYCKAKYGKK